MIFKKISIVRELYHLQYFSWAQLVDLGRVEGSFVVWNLTFSEEISIFFLKIFDKHWFIRELRRDVKYYSEFLIRKN